MNKASRNFVTLLTVLLFLIPALSLIAQNKVLFQEVTEIPEDKGLVYIYRTSSMAGAAVHFLILANGSPISGTTLKSGTYLEYIADPGTYLFRAESQPYKRTISVNVPSGRAVFIESNPNGLLEVVSSEIGLKRIKACKKIVKKKNE